MSNKFLRHEACPKCGSSDARSVYERDNGKEQFYCFSCQDTSYQKSDEVEDKPYSRKPMKNFISLYDVSNFPYADGAKRGIRPEVIKKFDTRASVNQASGLQDAFFYRYNIEGELSGYKVRVLPKDFTSIGTVGNIKGTEMFGQNICRKGGVKLLITEGEEDAQAAYQMLLDYALSKGKDLTPNVVSLVNGVSGAANDFERNWEFIDSFKEIILCFDQDKAGKEGVNKISSLITNGKFKIMTLPKKDPSAILKAGLEKEFISSFFGAKLYRPDGIVSIQDLYDKLKDEPEYDGTYYPSEWVNMNRMTFGRRLGDYDMFTAGTGCGKTQLFREMIYHDIISTTFKIGVLSLEENIKETFDGITGLHINKRTHLPSVKKDLTHEEKAKIYNDLVKTNRVEFYEHKGQADDRTIFAQIRHMAVFQDCKHIYLDHLGMLLGRLSAGSLNERADELMIGLRNIAQELNIWIGGAAHLRKTSNDGVSFERGGLPSPDDLKGSGALKQVPNTVFVIQRNGLHSDETMRDVLCIHIIKSRFVGKMGETDFFRFDHETGRISVISRPSQPILEPKKKKAAYDPSGEEAF